MKYKCLTVLEYMFMYIPSVKPSSATTNRMLDANFYFMPVAGREFPPGLKNIK